MTINKVFSLVFPEIKIIQYGRFADERGFFSEVYSKSVFQNLKEISFLRQKEIKQINFVYSKKNVVRGLHLQVTPGMDKLVRVVQGSIIDLFLDLRKGSKNFGKIAGYKLIADNNNDTDQYIWVPLGFAHGVVVLEESTIEYLCTSEYNPDGEYIISPLAGDMDWTSCDAKIRLEVESILKNDTIFSDKDKNGMSVNNWKAHPVSNGI